MDLLVGAAFEQLLKYRVERLIGGVWFEFVVVCYYVDIFVYCKWVDTRWH
jgi:hypothetical protein